ncbi:Clavaminate synthase-like protein [Mycena alexandri]|uniref:Clavaminate synthase-like protein n=1 Tax=Mycena alexandri TaxID=1745969 RepID=A0AAD6X2Q6_9AGAR|nr:Clavaminate synthase-like protein [Mycena alexandri]
MPSFLSSFWSWLPPTSCLPLPPSADASKFTEFGREVVGVDPGNLTSQQLEEVRDALYKHDVLLFRESGYEAESRATTSFDEAQETIYFKTFDFTSENYGPRNNKTEGTAKSILHPDLKTIPRVPQVQLIGNGTVYDHEGLAEAKLKHPSHQTFHKTVVSPEDEAAGFTRFYRWYIDAALYDLSPPRVCRYDDGSGDGSGDVLPVPLGRTAFVSGKSMFAILPPALKSVAVRARVKYAPHPYVWMASARAKSTGLGIESDGLEMALEALPPWEEAKLKVLPVTVGTGELSFQGHPCGVAELLIDPLPAGAVREGALYPDGAHLTDLQQVRNLLYSMQRPAIAPQLVYPHDWNENDLVLFHNRSVLHSVVGTLTPDQVRAFHQCNLAASDDPVGPGAEDVATWA